MARAYQNKFLKGISTSEFMDHLGCTIQEYKQYLESLFDDNMHWSNFGTYWEVDHSYPLGLAEDREWAVGLLHWSNTVPMWKTENSWKGMDLYAS